MGAVRKSTSLSTSLTSKCLCIIYPYKCRFTPDISHGAETTTYASLAPAHVDRPPLDSGSSSNPNYPHTDLPSDESSSPRKKISKLKTKRFESLPLSSNLKARHKPAPFRILSRKDLSNHYWLSSRMDTPDPYGTYPSFIKFLPVIILPIPLDALLPYCI